MDSESAASRPSLPAAAETGGEPAMLLKGQALEEYLAWLRSRSGRDYSITSVEISGTADDDRADLTAVISVRLNRAEGAILVPLELNEATLKDARYEGPGTATPEDNFQPEVGYRWWFQGRGDHKLTLQLIVPVRKELPWRRVQLKIPPTAISHLSLKLPFQRLQTRILPSTVWSRLTALRSGMSELEVRGMGNQPVDPSRSPGIDVAWQQLPAPKQVDAVLQSKTTIAVELTGEAVLMRANQSIRALQGSFTEVGVRLPPGYELLDLEGAEGSPNINHEIDESNYVRVTLPEPTSGPLELRWTLESEFPQSGGKLTIEGFETDRARNQTGEVAITPLEGFRITRREGEDRFVHRINAGDIVGKGPVGSAYRFLKQPFRLALDVKEVQPYVTVQPNLALMLAPDHVELDAEFEFHASKEGGAVQELELRWPGWKEEGWTIQPMETPDLVDMVSFEKVDGADHIRVQLVDRKSGVIILPLKASRAITPGEDPFRLSVPTGLASRRLSAKLKISHADNVESVLTPIGGSQARLLAALPDSDQSFEYSLDPEVQEFQVRATVHPREIKADTSLTLRAADDRVLVSQRIWYRVEYERLPHVHLLVPEAVSTSALFSSEVEPDLELTPSWTGTVFGSQREARFELSKPQLGRFPIDVSFEIPFPPGVDEKQPMSLEVPLVSSSNAEYSTVRVRLEPGERYEAAVVSSDWQRQAGMESLLEWMTRSNPEKIPVRLTSSHRHRTRPYVIRRALIRAVCDSSGICRTRAYYMIEGDPDGLRMRLPTPELSFEQASWNGRRLDASEFREGVAGTGEFRLAVQSPAVSVPGELNLLTVDYHTVSPAPFAWNSRHHLAVPQLDDRVWVDESVCELVLPGDQHLFGEPDGWTPQYSWKRETFYWSRQPRAGVSDLARWLGSDKVSLDEMTSDGGHAYVFSSFGPAGDIEFCAMSRSLIVLLGAGLALAAGFMLLKLSVTRSLLAFLAVAFAVAVAGLWYSGPIQVLLQPALLGLALALMAAVIDGTFTTSQQPALLTLASPSDFISPPAPRSSEKGFLFGAGSEDVTSLRQPRPTPPEPVSSSESGAG